MEPGLNMRVFINTNLWLYRLDQRKVPKRISILASILKALRFAILLKTHNFLRLRFTSHCNSCCDAAMRNSLKYFYKVKFLGSQWQITK